MIFLEHVGKLAGSSLMVSALIIS